MPPMKFLSTVALTVTAAALTLGVTSGVSYAGSNDRGDRSASAPRASSGESAPRTTTAATSDTATATVRLKQQNVVIRALSISDTATSTITVEDRRRSPQMITWNVPSDVKMSGFYTKLSDLQVGFTLHIAGSRTGDAAPTADHIVAPGRNKKVHLHDVTITAVNGAAGTITVRDKAGSTSTWSVRSARIDGKTKRKGDLSPGDVVSLRGERVEGSRKGAASVVRVQKDAPAKTKKGRSSKK